MSTRTKGNTGEDIACSFLVGKGFVVVDRNYLRKWGELDIVAEKDGTIHFIEVKSMSSATLQDENGHRPEDNMHGLKGKRLRRMIETYLEEKKGRLDAEFQFHVICVYMNTETRRARVKWLRNIIL